ncbi:MAG: hypothetical protein V4719_04945, partial [Planctomycetota bacterium]
MSETLSPSEVQSLFAGLDLSGGATASPGRQPAAPEQTWSSDQFTLPVAVAGDELARLQAWQTAFGTSWSQAWTAPFSSSFSLKKPSDLRVVRLRDYVTQHVGWQGFQVTSSRHDFPLWVALDDVLVAAHLDCLLGDQTPSAGAAQRSRGLLENQLTSRLVNSVCEALFIARAGTTPEWQFKPVSSVADWIAGIPVYLSCEIVQFDFEVFFSGTSGRLSLGIPRGACDRLAPSRLTSADHSGCGVAKPAIVQLVATLGQISL